MKFCFVNVLFTSYAMMQSTRVQDDVATGEADVCVVPGRRPQKQYDVEKGNAYSKDEYILKLEAEIQRL